MKLLLIIKNKNIQIFKYIIHFSCLILSSAIKITKCFIFYELFTFILLYYSQKGTVIIWVIQTTTSFIVHFCHPGIIENNLVEAFFFKVKIAIKKKKKEEANFLSKVCLMSAAQNSAPKVVVSMLTSKLILILFYSFYINLKKNNHIRKKTFFKTHLIF